MFDQKINLANNANVEIIQKLYLYKQTTLILQFFFSYYN